MASDTMVDRLLDAPTRILPPSLGRRRRGRGPSRLLALVALGGFFVVGFVLVAVGLSGGRHDAEQPLARAKPKAAAAARPAPAKTAPARRKRAAAKAIPIQAITAFDPAGDGQENNAEASLATDGNIATAWKTEHYRTWYKPGVGLVLDAGHPVRPTALTLETDNPGFAAEVQAGASPTGPFTVISQSSTTSDTTVYKLRPAGAERYVLVWITRIPNGGAADVNEVRLR